MKKRTEKVDFCDVKGRKNEGKAKTDFISYFQRGENYIHKIGGKHQDVCMGNCNF